MSTDNSATAQRVIDVFAGALKRFAEEGKNDGVTPMDTQIIIALRPSLPSGEVVPYYRVWKNMQPYMRARKIEGPVGSESTDEVGFKKILGFLLDFGGYEETCKEYLNGAFKRFQKQLSDQATKEVKAKILAEIEAWKKANQGQPNFDIRLAELMADYNAIDEVVPLGYFDDENDYKSFIPVIEIFIVTAKNDPIVPVALLYVEGQQVRELNINTDILQSPT